MITLRRMFTCFRRMRKPRIELGEPGGYPRLVENRRMGRGNVKKALQAVLEHRAMLQRRWSEIHG